MLVEVLNFFYIYVIYNLTLYSSIPGGDSGELVAEACHYGTPHPPGYPLHTLLSIGFHRFIKLPRIRFDLIFRRLFSYDQSNSIVTNQLLLVDWNPNVAWQVNHMCSIFGAIAAVILGCTCYELLCLLHIKYKSVVSHSNSGAGFANSAIQTIAHVPPSKFCIFVTSSLYAFSPLVWEYSIGSEVFALNNMLCAVLIYLTVLLSGYICQLIVVHQYILKLVSPTKFDVGVYDKSIGKVQTLVKMGAVVCGLTLANQHTSVLLVVVMVPYILWLLVYNREIFLIKGVSKDSNSLYVLGGIVVNAALGFLMGFLPPYSYLYFASLAPKQGSWGDMGSIRGLLRHVLREEYGTFQLGGIQGKEDMLSRVMHYLAHINTITPYGGPILMSVGFLWVFYVGSRSCEEMNSTKSKNIPSKAKIQNHSKNDRLKSNTGNADSSVGENLHESIEKLSYLSIDMRPVMSILLFGWMFYTLLWHGILSNLPMDAPMPFAVHSRFWMQPDCFVVIFMGLGIDCVCNVICSKNTFKLMIGTYYVLVMGFIMRASILNQFVDIDRSDVALEPLYASALSISHVYPHLDELLPSNSNSNHNISSVVEYQTMLSLYGNSILNSLPRGSLLASHTDLDWNTVRYLRNCEHEKVDGEFSKRRLRSDVSHVSFQLMPYPWFQKQQAPLYTNVKFPPPFEGVSTGRGTKGNAELVSRFIMLNSKSYLDVNASTLKIKNMALRSVARGPGLFLDMQAINDNDVEAGGLWRKGFTLVPWGLVYKVEKVMPLNATAQFHTHSWKVLTELRSTFPSISPLYLDKFPSGSWEFAAMSVIHDANYQYALNLLTYCIAAQKGVNIQTTIIILDRLLVASALLMELMLKMEYTERYLTNNNHSMPLSYLPPTTIQSKTILSTPPFDVYKNVAVAWLRLHGILSIVVQYKEHIYPAVDGLDVELLNKQQVVSLLQPDDVSISDRHTTPYWTVDRLKNKAKALIQSFVKKYPQDKDVATFKQALGRM